MGDNNNRLAGRLPSEPYPELRQLDRLVGAGEVSGSLLSGTVVFEWMEGGFFLIQRIDAEAGGRRVRGVEYIGYDEDTRTLRSHYMDAHGNNFAYTWEIDGDSIVTWFGDRGSDTFFEGRFGEDGQFYSGAWRWPGGGYTAIVTRKPL